MYTHAYYFIIPSAKTFVKKSSHNTSWKSLDKSWKTKDSNSKIYSIKIESKESAQ